MEREPVQWWMDGVCDVGFDDASKDMTSQAYSLQDLSRLQQVTELRKGLGVVNWWLKIDLLFRQELPCD